VGGAIKRTREFLEYKANVFLREADARPQHPDFQAALREWAARAKREAAEMAAMPEQMDFFSNGAIGGTGQGDL